jgi:peptide/nickel transport system substrate-binding protein
MKRRSLIAGAAALGVSGAAGLPRPAYSQAANRVIKFVPQANLTSPDPVWTTAIVTANHAHMVFDQLWTFDEGLTPHLQMLAAAETAPDGKRWRLTLRDGLAFHDGEPVRSKDCIASLTRWMKRDGMGQRIAAQMEEMKVVNDKSWDIILKKPFPLLPMAFANNCHMMPERLAQTDAFQQIPEVVGSGPFRFLRDEWVAGSRVAYARNEKYVSRSEKPSNMAGAKIVNIDRVEWHITTDPATAAAAVQTGEIDWVEQPLSDLLPVLRRARGVVIEPKEIFGNIGIVRFNHLHPPFNNQKLRQALLAVTDQKDYLAAVMGPDSDLTQAGVGVFTPGTPLASDESMDKLNGPRDLAAAKKLVAESGYKGERAVVMAPTDFAVINALAQVTRANCEKIGINVDYVATDWGALVQRRASRESVEKGGWSIFCTYGDGFTFSNPAVYTALWGTGEKAWFGWPTSPRIEALRDAWFDAPDLAAQQKLGREMQKVAFEEVPFIPTGLWRLPIARRSNVTDILAGTRPLFWNLKKS